LRLDDDDDGDVEITRMYLMNLLAGPLLPHATDLQPYRYSQHHMLAQQPFNYRGLRATNSQCDKGWPDLLVSDAMVMMAADDCRG
jgi:hypothetical protein